jgi:hypothetical protein
VALLEWAQPRRPFGESTGLRWFGNFGLQILGGVLVRALFPLFGVGWAAFCREHGLGLFNVVQSMNRFAQNPLDDAKFWKPAPLLAKLAAEGKTFNLST